MDLAELGEISKTMIRLPHSGSAEHIKHSYKAASKLTPAERAAARRLLAQRKAERLSPPSQTRFRREHPQAGQLENMYTQLHHALKSGKAGTRTGQLGHSLVPGMATVGGMPAATMKFGGKSSREAAIGVDQTIGWMNRGVHRDLLAHELQHARPRRSAWRLSGQILANPQKTAREEARADSFVRRGGAVGYGEAHRSGKEAGGNYAKHQGFDIDEYHKLRNKLQPGVEARPLSRRDRKWIDQIAPTGRPPGHPYTPPAPRPAAPRPTQPPPWVSRRDKNQWKWEAVGGVGGGALIGGGAYAHKKVTEHRARNKVAA